MSVRPPLLGTFAGVLTLACGSGRSDAPAEEGKGELRESASAQPTPEFSGCYTLTVEAEGWRVPGLVELQSDPLTGWSGDRFADARTARSWPSADASPQDAPFAYWHPVEGDSIEVGHPGALAGMTLRLGATESQALSGWILSFTDALPPGGGSGRDSATVRADPVRCPVG